MKDDTLSPTQQMLHDLTQDYAKQQVPGDYAAKHIIAAAKNRASSIRDFSASIMEITRDFQEKCQELSYNIERQAEANSKELTNLSDAYKKSISDIYARFDKDYLGD